MSGGGAAVMGMFTADALAYAFETKSEKKARWKREHDSIRKQQKTSKRGGRQAEQVHSQFRNELRRQYGSDAHAWEKLNRKGRNCLTNTDLKRGLTKLGMEVLFGSQAFDETRY